MEIRRSAHARSQDGLKPRLLHRRIGEEWVKRHPFQVLGQADTNIIQGGEMRRRADRKDGSGGGT